jgi:hypothetical protein
VAERKKGRKLRWPKGRRDENCGGRKEEDDFCGGRKEEIGTWLLDRRREEEEKGEGRFKSASAASASERED